MVEGLEDLLAKLFPRVEAVILDFWHVAEFRQWCHRLKSEGEQAGRAALTELPTRGRAAWASLDKVRTNFSNQVHRMDNPTYRSKSW
jgi:hypothetical protein